MIFQSSYYKTCNICVFTVNCWHFPSLIYARSLQITCCVVFLQKKICLSLWYSSGLGLRHLKYTMCKLFPTCSVSVASCSQSFPCWLPTTFGGHVPGCLPAQHQTSTAASSIIPHTPAPIPSNYCSCRLKSPMETLLYGVQFPDIQYYLPFSHFRCSL